MINEIISQQFDINQIRLIVGLGNTGKEYDGTRHNVGFKFLDMIEPSAEFNEEAGFKAKTASIELNQNRLMLAKPTTMMNLSGDSVQLISHFYRISTEQILVVHDDLDINLGQYKIQFATGPKVHNGLNSIENKLSDEHFWRLRIGVENRSPELRKIIPGASYVLGGFTDEEEQTIEALIKKIIDDWRNILAI